MRVLLVGDVMLGRLVNEQLRREAPAYPWGDTLGVLREADVRICNLECAISDDGAPWTATPKVFHFRTDARNVAVLQAGGIHAVSLANNHALDYGYEALLDTIGILDVAGIQHAGAGRTLAEASRAAIIEAGGGRIGMLAFTDNEPDWAATPGEPGIWYVPVDSDDERAMLLLDRVRQLREQVDLLIVSAHWGPNWGYRPPASHAPFAHALIKAGADVVFGHSGHVLRGVEWYRARPVLYCAGDFIDDYAVDNVERNDESCVFCVETDGREIRRVLAYPTVIREFQAGLAQGDAATRIATLLQRLCAAFRTSATWDAASGVLTLDRPAPASRGET